MEVFAIKTELLQKTNYMPQQGHKKDFFPNGSVLEGIIINKQNNITTVMFEGNQIFNFGSDNVLGNLSDKVSFKIMSKENNTLKLKQIITQADTTESVRLQSVENIERLFKKLNFIQDSEKEQEALNVFKSRLRKLSSDANIINELVASGISLDKINLFILADASKTFDDYKKAASTEDDISSEKILNAVNRNLEILEASKSLDEKSKLSLIKNNTSISPENLLIHKHTSSCKTQIDFDNIESEIKKLFAEQDISMSEENFKIAEKFVHNAIDINPLNIKKYIFLNKLDLNPKHIASETVDAINSGIKPVSIDLFKLGIYESNLQASEKLASADENNIQSLLDENIEITIDNLHKYSYENKNISNEALEFKKTLAEVQLKLTAESCYRLAGKDIDISFMPIKNLLTQLNGLLYEKNLELMNVNANEININKMSETFNSVNNFKFITPLTYKDIMFNKVEFNLGGISKSALDNYNIFQTAPSAKYGDKINSEHISDFLKSIGYTDSEENRNAFKILYKNNMDVNPENLDKIKLLAYKLKEIQSELKPNIVAQMLKENIDPSKLDIDEMIDYIEKFKEVYGTTQIESLEESLMRFEKDGNRDSIYSVYRMFHTISKNNFKAIGFLFKNEFHLTMENLFEASKYINKRKDYDFTVDSKFGYQENHNEINILKTIQKALTDEIASTPPENRIKLEEFFKTRNKTLFDIKMAKEFLSYDYDLNNRILDKSDLMKFEINDFIKGYKAAENFSPHKSENNVDILSEAYYSFIECDDSILSFLADNDLEPTKSNIEAAKELLDNPEALAEKLNDTSVADFIDNENLLDDNYLDEIYSKIDFKIQDITTVNKIKNLISLQKKLDTKSIPVKLGGKITTLNMFILNEDIEDKEELDILMSIESNLLGTVKFDISMNDNEISLNIKNKNYRTLKILNDNKDLLNLENTGFNLKNISFESE